MPINQERLSNLLVQADFLLKKGHLNNVLVITNQILEEDPQSIPAANLEAEVLIFNGKPQAGLDTLKTLTFAPHETGTPFDENQLKTLTLQARALLFLTKFDDCEKLLRKILNTNHGHLDAVEIQADLDLDKGRLPKAISIYKSLLEQNYQPNQILFSLGQAYLKNQDNILAYDCFLKLKKAGVHHQALSKFIEDTRNRLAPEAVKHRSQNNKLDGVLFWLFPFLAEDKVLAHVHENLDESKAEAELLKDPLSGCKSKAAVTALLPNLQLKAKAPNSIFLGLVEIDYLVNINLFYGHDVGNEVIRLFGSLLKASFGEEVFRLAGNQFLFCVETTEAPFINAIKAFRVQVEFDFKNSVNMFLTTNLIKDEEGNPIKLLWDITCSIGSTIWPNKSPLKESFEEAQASFNQCTLKSVGKNSVFFKMQMVDNGPAPTDYNHALVRELNKMAIGKGKADWWELSAGLPPSEFKSLLEQASTNLNKLNI